jgi:cyclophilin family peptidyl-prolyl cis-trans isomerase
MSSRLCLTVLFGLAFTALTVGCGAPEPESIARTLLHLSPVYEVDQVYRSMQGPSSTQTVTFAEAVSDPPELLWVTGYTAVMVGEDGKTEMPQEFMCHSNLDFDSDRHADLMELPRYHGNRLFTLSQGQQEVRLPDGFGLPYWSDETFSVTTQVLNLNPDGTTHRIRHRVTIDYVRDRDVDPVRPMQPLFMTSGWGLVLLEGEDGFYGVSDPDEEIHGEGCLPGVATGRDKYTDAYGRKFAGHWVVPPGREVNRTFVTEIMEIPYDTTMHYAAVHLHPFAESLELVDLTTGESVFKSSVENHEDKIGIKRVEYFASEEGIPLFADHDYEVVSVYNNTSGEEQDSMAVFLFYLADRKFVRRERAPDQARVAHVELPVAVGEEHVVLRTSHGEITLALYPGVAPRHVERMLKLVDRKILQGTAFTRVEPEYLVQTGYPKARRGAPLSAEQAQVLRPLGAEFSDIPHQRGVVSMVLNDDSDPNSAVASFFITLGPAEHLDGKYTVFGRVMHGFDVIEQMSEVPRDGSAPIKPIVIGAEKRGGCA